jgi:hypothetical protein
VHGAHFVAEDHSFPVLLRFTMVLGLNPGYTVDPIACRSGVSFSYRYRHEPCCITAGIRPTETAVHNGMH